MLSTLTSPQEVKDSVMAAETLMGFFCPTEPTLLRNLLSPIILIDHQLCRVTINLIGKAYADSYDSQQICQAHRDVCGAGQEIYGSSQRQHEVW